MTILLIGLLHLNAAKMLGKAVKQQTPGKSLSKYRAQMQNDESASSIRVWHIIGPLLFLGFNLYNKNLEKKMDIAMWENIIIRS